MLRLCKQCHSHFGDEDSCPHCGAAVPNVLGRAVKAAATAVTAAAMLTNCGIGPRPLYGVPICHSNNDCVQGFVCDTATGHCEKPDGGP